MKKIIWLFSFLFFIGMTIFGQEVKISGVVSTESGESLPGVSILVKGTTTGTITDIDGHYMLNANVNDVVVASFIGFDTKEIVITGNNTNLDIILKEASISLNEVVAIGYGKAKRKDLTSSIASVQGDEVKAMSVGNPVQALQGKAPGLQVVAGGGSPGAAPKVLIRGFTSINLSTDPLYVVDGVPMGTNLNFLNSSEIESIDVLKDASAAAIYGSRASNGVILVTTKKGSDGKPVFSADFSYGIQVLNKPFDMANAEEYATTMNQSLANAGLGTRFDDPASLGSGTDWWGEGVNKYAPQRNASLQVTGGDEKYKYAVSLSYFDQESFYNSGNWKRITGRVTLDWKFSDKVSFGVSMNPRRELWDNTPSWYQDYLLQDPISPIYRPEEEQVGLNQYSIFQRSYYTYVWNPIARDARNFGNGGYYALTSSSYLTYKPIRNLEIKTQLSGDFRFNHTDDFVPDFTIDGAHEHQDINYVFRDHEFNRYLNWTNTATYTLERGGHNASLMGGATFEKYYGRNIEGDKEGVPNNSELLRELEAATVNDYITGNQWESSIESFMGRFSYNYKNRYYLTATYRIDGASKFLGNNKWAAFPSASVAWRISDEDFLSNLSFVDDIKLRAGWGRLGNQNLPSSVYESKLAQNYYVFGSGQGTVVNATEPEQMKNEDIKWETVEDINIGTDFTLFDNAITGSFEYYRKNTKDMLFNMPYPYYSGFPGWSSIWSNIGSMKSSGIEIALNYHGKSGDFKYDVGFTLMTGSVEATKLPSTTPIIYGNGERTKTVVGDEPGYFFGYKTDGLFQNQFDVNSHSNDTGDLLQPYAQPGDIRFVDTNGDGELTGDDRVKLGSPWPDFTGGVNISAGYKGFDLLANLYASVGNDLVNDIKKDLYSTTASESNVISGLLSDAWHGEGTSNSIPRVSHVDNNQNYDKFSDFYVEDGSYLRLKNIQLGYTLPQNISKRMGMSKCRVYVSGQNIATWTYYSGVEPEVSGDVLSFGFGGWTYPVLPTYLVGVNINF